MTADLATHIRACAAAGDIDSIITLAEVMRDQRDRAELLATSYLHQIKRLATSFAAITEPATGKPIAERAPPKAPTDGSTRRPSPKAPTAPSAAVEISLDDL